MISYAAYVLSHMETFQVCILIAVYPFLELGGIVCCHALRYTYSWTIHMQLFSFALILWSTIFLRTPGMEHQANLIPLWSWYQGFFLGNDEIRWQIYFNILLFVPFGCLLYLYKARSLSKSLLQGFLLSVVIELCQLLFKLGLFEWDDMLHNTLGCMLGGFSAKTIERVWDLHRLHKTAGRK